MYPKLTGFDHIHIYVSDKNTAEKWYAENLGFTRIIDFDLWNVDQGPLFIGNDCISLALFESKSSQKTTIAFGTDSKNFIAWKAHLESNSIPFTVVDHKLSWSIYFKDLDNNPFEITSYEYNELTSSLNKKFD